MIKKFKKNKISPVHRDTIKRIQRDPEFAEAYFEELFNSPIAVQLVMLRRLRGLPQTKVASKLHIKQAFVSRLESLGSNHRLNTIEELTRVLGAKLIVLPKEAVVIFRGKPALAA